MGNLSKLLMSRPLSGAVPTIKYITVNAAYNITENLITALNSMGKKQLNRKWVFN